MRGPALITATSRRDRPAGDQRAQHQDRSCKCEPPPADASLPQATCALA
jgi:hypothetical protein